MISRNAKYAVMWQSGFAENTNLSDNRGLRHPTTFYTLPILLWITLLLSVSHAADPTTAPFRIGFSSSMFTDVNENDARASVKAWGQTVAREQGIPTDPEPMILKDPAALLQALRSHRVDVVGITMLDFGALRHEVRFGPVFVNYNSGRTTEEYVLLASRDSRIETVSDLRGRHVAFHTNPRLCLAPLWLDTLLVQKGFPPSAGFLGGITQNSKLARVVLPVFFHQCDACVVTRSGFNTMNELNPQVGKQLKIIATSTDMVPCAFAFRADYDSPLKEQVFAGIRDLHKTPAGQQILTIFHSEKIEDQPAACLDSALELMATYTRLCGATNQSATIGVGVPALGAGGGSAVD